MLHHWGEGIGDYLTVFTIRAIPLYGKVVTPARRVSPEKWIVFLSYAIPFIRINLNILTWANGTSTKLVNRVRRFKVALAGRLTRCSVFPRRPEDRSFSDIRAPISTVPWNSAILSMTFPNCQSAVSRDLRKIPHEDLLWINPRLARPILEFVSISSLRGVINRTTPSSRVDLEMHDPP